MTFALTDNGFNLFNWGAFKGMLASFLMTIVQLLCMGVFFMENVFWVLIRGVKMSDGSYRNIIDGLLFNGQSLADNKITAIVGVIVLIAIALTILASVIAVVKANFSTKDEDRSPKIAIIGVVKAIVLMVVFPLIIYVILLITNTLTNAICQYANFDATDKNSIANQLFFMFMNPSGRSLCIDPITQAPLFSFTLNDLSSLGYSGSTWEQLKACSFVNGANGDGLFGYSYILATIVTIILIYALFKAVLMLVRRIFDITVLYVIAPLPIACYPSDEGKRYDIWKDLTASKIVSAFGLGLTFVVYSILINVLSETFTDWARDLGGGFRMLNLCIENGEINGGSLLTLVYIFVLISGALAIPNMYNLLASLVSSQAGMVAHHDMQAMAGDLAYLQRGRQGVTRAALGSAGLALGALKTGLFGDKNARYALMARGGRGGNANDGKVKSAALGFLAGGLLGGTASLISQGHSNRVDKKADAIRKDAIANYDNKAKLRSANSELKKLKCSEVTAMDVINEEKAKQAEKAANAIAKRNREGKK